VRVQVSKKSVSQALSALERVIPSRSSNPLLTALHIQPTPQGLTLSGTSLEIDLRVTVAAEVDIEDQAPLVVPGHLFIQIVRNMGGELIELEKNGNELAIRSLGSDFKLQCGDAPAYPELTFSTAPGVQLSAPALLKGVAAARYAVSGEAFQAVFRGLLLSCASEELTVVGSDGFRLGFHLAPAPGFPDGSLIVPGRSMDEVVRVLAGQEHVTLYWGQDGVLNVRSGHAEVNVKLLDGDYPDWQRVVPKDFVLSYKVSSVELAESVGRVALLSDKNANNRVELVFRPGMMPSLQLLAEGDYGRGQNVISVHDATSDDHFGWGYNSRYLLDALKTMEGDTLLQFSSAGICLLTGGGERPARAVVVALRV
jgi:DNA polymerase-3 subunit beta